MARFQWNKLAFLKLESKAARFGLAAVVFCLTLASGLSYRAFSNLENAQLDDLARQSAAAREVLDARFAALDDDVRDGVRRVVGVTSEIMNDSTGPGESKEPQAEEQVAGPGGERQAERQIAGGKARSELPLEERWRSRLARSLEEVAAARSDIVDVTYLGRFTGVPNSALMVARVERDAAGSLRESEADPRPEWDSQYLQRVIQSEFDGALVSEPLLPESAEGDRAALVRGAAPVRGSDGSVVGLVLISVKLSDVLSAVGAALPPEATSLLVTEAGTALVHPTPDMNLTRGERAAAVLSAVYPELLAAFEAQDSKDAFAFRGGERAHVLTRFDAGGPASELRLSLVVAAPIAELELASAAQLVSRLGPNAVNVGLASAGGAALLGVGLLFLRARRRRRSNVDRIADEAETGSVLSERAEAIEAEDAAAGDAEAVAEAETAAPDPDEMQELPDLARMESEEPANAAEDDPVPDAVREPVASDDEQAVSDADAEDEPVALESAESAESESESETETESETEPQSATESHNEPAHAADPEEPAARVERAEDPIESGRETQISAQRVEPGPVPARVSPIGAESAREPARLRGSLEAELEEARQRTLDELAAARERFEAELAREREQAIERLVSESRELLAGELGGAVQPGEEPRVPAIEPCEFDLRQLLSEVAAWLEGEPHGRNAGFEVRCSRGVPNRLVGDPEWVGPLLVNLARHALRCSEGGAVSLSVSSRDEGPKDVELCFEVSAPETGLAADANGQVRELQPVGLALSQQLVESMRGALEVERVGEAQSRVRVLLPMPLPN